MTRDSSTTSDGAWEVWVSMKGEEMRFNACFQTLGRAQAEGSWYQKRDIQVALLHVLPASDVTSL